MRTSTKLRALLILGSAALLCAGIPSANATAKGSGKISSGASITVSKFASLNPNGEDILVNGKNFDTKTGIYVALCRLVKNGVKPDPCGGGADMSGTSGASAWVASNPPAYGASIATPFTSSGSFTVKLRVSAKVGSFDCRKVRCAIYTRADHLSGGDRNFDIAVPVTFAKKGKPVAAFIPLPKPSATATQGATTVPAASPSPSASAAPKEKNSVVATTSTGLVLKTAGMPPVLKISTPIEFTVTSTSGVTPIVVIDAATTKGVCTVAPTNTGYELIATSGTQCVVVVNVPANDKFEAGIGIYPFIVQP